MTTSVNNVPSLYQLAAEAMQGTDHHVQAAVDSMIKKLQQDATLFNALVLPILKTACTDECFLVLHHHRAAIVRGSTGAANYRPAARGRLVASAHDRATLLDFPLPTSDGLKMRDAGKDDLAKASVFYEKQAATMATYGRWFNLVRARVPKNKTVGDVLNAKQLQQLMDKAGGGKAKGSKRG